MTKYLLSMYLVKEVFHTSIHGSIVSAALLNPDLKKKNATEEGVEAELCKFW